MKKENFRFLLMLLYIGLIIQSCAFAPRMPLKKVDYFPEKKALIYFYSAKESKYLLGIPYNIKTNDYLISFIRNGCYPVLVEPGIELNYEFQPSSFPNQKDSVKHFKKINLKVESGKTYYVKFLFNYATRFNKAKANYTIVPPQIGEKEIEKCNLAFLIYGKASFVPSHPSKGQNEIEKAIVYAYRPAGTLETAAVPASKIAFEAPGGYLEAIKLPACYNYKFVFEPGEVKFFRVPIYLRDHQKLFYYRFDAKAGRTYFMKVDPIFPACIVDSKMGEKEIAKCNNLIKSSSESEKNLGIENIVIEKTYFPSVLFKFDKARINDVLKKKDKIGIVWMCENNTAKLYKVKDSGIEAGVATGVGLAASGAGTHSTTISGTMTGAFISGGLALVAGAMGEIVTGIANVKLNNRLKKEKIAPHIKNNYIDALYNMLTLDGFQIITLENPYDKKKLKKVDRSPKTFYDFRTLAKTLQVDTIIALDILNFGVERKYKTFSPVGNPKGSSFVIGYLIDGHSNELISKIPIKVQKKCEGEWDTSPDFLNLIEATQESLKTAIDEVLKAMFSNKLDLIK